MVCMHACMYVFIFGCFTTISVNQYFLSFLIIGDLLGGLFLSLLSPKKLAFCFRQCDRQYRKTSVQSRVLTANSHYFVLNLSFSRLCEFIYILVFDNFVTDKKFRLNYKKFFFKIVLFYFVPLSFKSRQFVPS